MINFELEKIVPLCKEFGLDLDALACERLNAYGNLLLEWNEKINLTAITAPRDVLYKHFYDCLLIFKYINPKPGAKIIDVGTGAGFPGMVIKIARPDIELTLLDGLNKRLTFLQDVLSKLDLTAEMVHLRAEEGGKDVRYREKYDIACARAVASMNVLSEYCLPFVKKEGLFLAMKGPAAAEEVLCADKAIRLLGGAKPDIICEMLPENEPRTLVLTKKLSQTPPKYPRIGAKIAKQPL